MAAAGGDRPRVVARAGVLYSEPPRGGETEVGGGAIRDWEAFNRGVVEHFRFTGGVGPGRWAGRPLLLLTTTGARSGRPRTVPLLYSTDGDRLVVIAWKGGEPTNPDWYHNLVTNPIVTVELPGATFRARATVADGAERRRLFDRQAALMPFFAEYERTTERAIPVVVLERIREAEAPDV